MSESDLEIRSRACDRLRSAPQRLRSRTRLALRLGAAIVAAMPLCSSCSDAVDPELAPLATPAARALESPRKSQKEIRGDWAYRLEKKREWWGHARDVLFAGIDLSDEQARAIDSVIEEQLATRERLQESDAEVQTARAAGDSERIEAARASSVAIRSQLKDLHTIYEELRALLREEQRSAFDMNRARHVAENRAPAARRTLSEGTASPGTTTDASR